MATAVVAFNGTRVNAMDAATNTGHWGGSGPAPAAEAPLAYQNSLAVNKKTTSTTLSGIDYDPASGALDMTAAANALWFVKVYVSDSFDVNATFGVSAGIGSANNAYYVYNIAGSGAALSKYDTYPAQGGYILTAIDPNIAAWRSGTIGSPSLTAVDWFGVQCAVINGAAKAENLAFDAIDVGTGLTITAGDGASTEGNFTDFVTFDQDTITNRYGCCSGSGGAIKAWCLFTIGSASVTEFLDTTSIVTFADGYHSAGLVGTAVSIANASSIIQIDCTIIGEGTRNGVDANDTRPDFVVTGTSGTFSSAANLRNHRNITYTSVCDVENADIECQLLTQASANISNSVIRTNALTSVACLQDPTFGTTTDLHDVEFIQTGAGHAIELDTATTYNLTNITFTGYGADTTDSAALDVTASSGTVTVNVLGGSTPTYKTAGATVDIIVNPVTTLITVKDIDTKAVLQNARVRLTVTDGVNFPFEDSVTITSVTTTATVTHTAHGLETNDWVEISGVTNGEEYNGAKQITVTGVNTYTYTLASAQTSPATGTITSTFMYFNTLTNVSGVVTDTRSISADQAVEGEVRKGSSSPYYVPQPIAGTIDSDNGLSLTIQMIKDE